MAVRQRRDSYQYLESVLVGSSVLHGFLMAFKNGEHHMEMDLYVERLLLTSPLLILCFVLYARRGLRVHIFPYAIGLLSYTFALAFCLIEESAYYFYLINTMISLILILFFGGRRDFYGSFEFENVSYPNIGFSYCQLPKECGNNRVAVYYPADVEDPSKFRDVQWVHVDSEKFCKALSKFFFNFLPECLFKYLLEAHQNVFLSAPITTKAITFTPVVFSHSLAQTNTFFSTIFKDLASQGFVVFSIEHGDQTALQFRSPAGRTKVFKNLKMSELNQMAIQMNVRY